ncbi:MAG: hypothetical protein QOG15_1459 [Solirubrobacteraceae bacterium]|jgi:hypothetical protein|nr:hypothetical protein [Solirubrobacteraceae bacterium]
MHRTKVVGALAGVAAISCSAVAIAQISSGVPNANPRTGSPVNIVAPGAFEQPLVHGTDQIENPMGPITRYGYLNDELPVSAGGTGEPTKTEPDGNTYLRMHRPGGPTAGYDYGRHFLFQSHENGKLNTGANGFQAYITRINLDVQDPAHRVTLLTTPDTAGNTGFTRLDGSTYDPFSGEILGAQEGNGTTGGVIGNEVKWSSTSPPATHTYYGSIGRAGYEGIHNDSDGNLLLVEDVGGSNVIDPAHPEIGAKTKQPNSFVYRFVPTAPGNLNTGKLQALRVTVDGTVVSFHGTGGCADGSGRTSVDDTFGPEMLKLHSGASFATKWVTLHNTATDGTTPFDANALAKAACTTPFKRPENFAFVPHTRFRSLVFDETGDTNADAGHDPNAAARGAWGSLYRLDFDSTGSATGSIKALVNGDEAHASFDTLTFLDEDTVLTGEDRGETLHTQLDRLDSLWSFDITRPLGSISADAKRVVAQGRDPSATANAEHLPPNSGSSNNPSNFNNDGDNEVTGVHASDGDDDVSGLLGTKQVRPGARLFYTQQHGDNVTYQIIGLD